MPRPKSEHPTPGELEVLKVLWDRGPCTVRQVWEVLDEQRQRHYTSVNSLLNVMTDKGLLQCNTEGRAYLYAANVDREDTAGELAEDLVGRVFGGSASGLLLKVLDRCNPSAEEMDEIAKIIREYRRQREK